MYWLKICKAWVRSQIRWAWNWLKLNITSSNVLRIIIIIHWLPARRDIGLTQGSLIPGEHSPYRALKHSTRQQELNLNLSQTKQPPPIITNSHLNVRRRERRNVENVQESHAKQGSNFTTYKHSTKTKCFCLSSCNFKFIIAALTLPRSIIKAQLSVASRRAVTAECKERKPDWCVGMMSSLLKKICNWS